MRRTLLLEECVGVQVNTDDISRRVVQVKVAGVDAHDKGHGGAEHISQHQWAQRDVGALPVQWEDHLGHQEWGEGQNSSGGRVRGGRSWPWVGGCLLEEGSKDEPRTEAVCPCRLCPRRRLGDPPQGRVQAEVGAPERMSWGRWAGGGALTETRASQTLVSRSGRSEWTSSLCSVSTASSSVMASSGPRLCSSCRKLAPLWARPR